ncbi:MAG: hypothetical protein JJU41_06570 [Bacteroidetes bacterium]|nr:hypothetical protein [Bacteroidota bacterium]MCH8523138.1 DUF3592 domain-containing protein [Balneolales bacterium]
MYKILRLAIWLLPLYIGYQLGYQMNVLYSMHSTYTTGEIVTARVTDFRIKQIAAQTNGFIVLDFTTSDGTHVNQLLSLPVQMAAPLMNFGMLDVRYNPSNTQDIVITATYQIHRNMVVVNIAVLTLSFMAVVLIAVWATKLANRRIKQPEDPVFVRVDE